MRKLLFLSAIILPITLLVTGCISDYAEDTYTQDDFPNDTIITILANGKVTKGHYYSSINETTFYLDFFKYKITDGHLEVSCFNQSAGSAKAVIQPRIRYKGVVYEVTHIADKAFYCSPIASLSIPNSIVSIGDGAFQDCLALESITLPESITEIGCLAFSGCTSLTSVNIPENISIIEHSTFSNCKHLTAVVIPDQVTYIAQSAFSGCSSLSSIQLPKFLSYIGRNAFSGCSSLTSIDVPDIVAHIGQYAFADCGELVSVSIPKTTATIESPIFSGPSSLKSIKVASANPFYDSREDCNAIIHTGSKSLVAGCNNTIIPKGVTSIGDNAFKSCDEMTRLSIPDGVTDIGKWAFAECGHLSTITMPESMSHIDSQAFLGCTDLQQINCYSTTPPACNVNAVFDDRVYTHVTLYVPEDALPAYKSTAPWASFQHIKSLTP